MQPKLELLAPVGRWSVLEDVVGAGADAVYLGGKRFNMRLLRPGFNFTDQELVDAVSLCHDRGIKMYVTVNNLYFENELDELKEYLAFLCEIGADALIVQDYALAKIKQDMKLDIPLHASVQMGINNTGSVKMLENSGFARVILSKNVSLNEIAEIHGQSGLELEFFVHGDVCISHTGQCLMSSLVFAESGNRGRCRKPCRWPFRIEGPHLPQYQGYLRHLIHNDLCFYRDIPGLIKAGVVSFKIEGRMRDADYLTHLISAYRSGIDRFLAGVEVPEEDVWQRLQSRRIRDFSSGNLYGLPQVSDIGITGEREPYFPTEARKLVPQTDPGYKERTIKDAAQPHLSVKVGGFTGLKAAIEKKADTIIIPGSIYRSRPEGFASLSDLSDAVRMGLESGIAMVLDLPRLALNSDEKYVSQLLSMPYLDKTEAIIVHDPGQLQKAVSLGYRVWAGQGLNLTNSEALAQIRSWGAVKACASIEMRWQEMLPMITKASLPVEVMVQGSLCGIISDYCLPRNMNCTEEICSSPCLDNGFALVDTYEQIYPLECDMSCRMHIYAPLELALFGDLPVLAVDGVESIRIDGDRYPSGKLKEVIEIYQAGLKDLANGQWKQKENFNRLLNLFPNGTTREPLMTGAEKQAGLR